MLNWLFGENLSQRLKELAAEMESIDAQITTNTEVMPRKKLELQRINENIDRLQKSTKQEEN
jgi:hypothetical protein